MNTNTKNYKVVIDGERYNLVSDEGEIAVLKAAALVDEIIGTLSSQLEHVDKRKIAVLAALQLASNYLQAENLLTQYKEQQDRIDAQIEQMVSLL